MVYVIAVALAVIVTLLSGILNGLVTVVVPFLYTTF